MVSIENSSSSRHVPRVYNEMALTRLLFDYNLYGTTKSS